MDFTEELEIEKGFSQFYSQKIEPEFRLFKKKRDVYRLCAIIAKALVVLAIYFALIPIVEENNPEKNSYYVLFLMILGVVEFRIISYFFSSFYLKKLEFNLINQVISFFGDFTYKKSDINLSKIYKKFDILPKLRYAKGFGNLSGSYSGVNFSVEKLMLVSDPDNYSIIYSLVKFLTKGSFDIPKDRIKFTGLVILLDLKRRYNSKTVIRKENQGFLSLFKLNKNFDDKKIKNVRLEDPKFEDIFEVYSNDQIEARYILTTLFMERLILLSNLLGNPGIEFSFVEDKVSLILPYEEELLTTFPIKGDFDMVEKSKIITKKINLIFDIIDVLGLTAEK